MKSTTSTTKRANKSDAVHDEAVSLQTADSTRQTESIAMAAYYRAERRGFAPGNELDDWFQAESELNPS